MYRTSSSNPASNNVQADTDTLNNKHHPELVDDNPPTMHKRSASNAEWKTWQAIKPAIQWVSETDNKVIALPLSQALPVAQPVPNLLSGIVHHTTSSISSLSTTTTSTSTTTSCYSLSSHSTPILTTSILGAPVPKKIAPQKKLSQTFTPPVH